MRILFTCDLHGRRHLYEQTLNHALKRSADCIIIGGDLLPTSLKDPHRLVTGSFDFSASLRVQIGFIDSYLAPLINGFTRNHTSIRVFYIPGNHDWEFSMGLLEKSLEDALCLHGRMVEFGGITFAGYGCVTDSSFWVKDYVRRDTPEDGFIGSRYPLVSTEEGIVTSPEGQYALGRPSIREELTAISPDTPETTVFTFHSPPYGTGIDTLHNGNPIGSRAVTEFIIKYRPLVSLHGHIHEAPYMTGSYYTMIGPTLAINPGHDPRRLHAVTFDTDDPKATLDHSVFGSGPVDRAEFNRAKDRYVRIIKALFMKKVLMK